MASAYAELIATGVRPLAQMLLIIEPAAEMPRQLDWILHTIGQYRVGAARRVIAKDDSQIALELVLYSKDSKESRVQAIALLDLFEENRNIKGVTPRALMLARKIGQMLGYSKAAIAEHVASMQKYAA